MSFEERLSEKASMRPAVVRFHAVRMMEELVMGRRLTPYEDKCMRQRIRGQMSRDAAKADLEAARLIVGGAVNG